MKREIIQLCLWDKDKDIGRDLWIVAFTPRVVDVLHVLVEMDRLLAESMLLHGVLRHFRPLSTDVSFLWRMLLHLMHGMVVLLYFHTAVLFGWIWHRWMLTPASRLRWLLTRAVNAWPLPTFVHDRRIALALSLAWTWLLWTAFLLVHSLVSQALWHSESAMLWLFSSGWS